MRIVRAAAVRHRVSPDRRRLALGLALPLFGTILLLASSSAAAAEWSLLTSSLAFSASTRPSVSCTSKRACLTVSTTWNGSKRLPEASAWNGSEWKDADAPFPSGASEASLEGVTCVSAKRCLGVGGASSGDGRGTLVEQATYKETWEWTVVHPPNPAEAEESNLSSISCAGAKACMATGWYYTHTNDSKTLAEFWNGKKWSVEVTPNPAGANETGLLGSSFSGVSCASADSCTAVGYYYTKSSLHLRMFAEHWNGSEWALQTVAEPPAEGEGELEAVSCPLAESCFAVGAVQTGKKLVAAAEHWNGSEWAFETAAEPEDSRLASVSCSKSAESCTAVGWQDDKEELTLAEHWNGSAWSLQQTINPPKSSGSSLEGVSCYATEACIATGQAALAKEPSLLAEQSTKQRAAAR
jgi:hypothetical protein